MSEEPKTTTEAEMPEDPTVVATDEQEAGEASQAMADEVARWRDLAVRTAADFDNFRKRVAREREEAVRFGNQDLLEQLIPILDNFEMGMMAAAQDASSMIYIGMDMVRKQFTEFLSQQGVEEVVALHNAFDPNLHEAVSEEVSAEHAPGTVIRVLRRGFRLRERLLRPANVVVAKAQEASEG
jgi:molecular chaperone GrpE